MGKNAVIQNGHSTHQKGTFHHKKGTFADIERNNLHVKRNIVLGINTSLTLHKTLTTNYKPQTINPQTRKFAFMLYYKSAQVFCI